MSGSRLLAWPFFMPVNCPGANSGQLVSKLRHRGYFGGSSAIGKMVGGYTPFLCGSSLVSWRRVSLLNLNQLSRGFCNEYVSACHAWAATAVRAS